MMRPSLTWEVLGPDAMCPRPVYRQYGATYFYDCTTHQLWTKGSALLSAYSPGPQPMRLLIGCACGAALLWLLYQMRRATLAGDREGRLVRRGFAERLRLA
jgi:hypothetical protein